MKSAVRLATIFLAKCIVFMVVYWLSYGIVFLPSSSPTVNSAASRQDDANRQITEKYLEQLKQSEQMLNKQKELLDRWEKIIEQWERSAPTGK